MATSRSSHWMVVQTMQRCHLCLGADTAPLASSDSVALLLSDSRRRRHPLLLGSSVMYEKKHRISAEQLSFGWYEHVPSQGLVMMRTTKKVEKKKKRRRRHLRDLMPPVSS